MISEVEYTRARTTTTISDCEPASALDLIALLVDGASDRNDAEGIDHAFRLAEEFRATAVARNLGPDLMERLHFYVANAWSTRTRFVGVTGRSAWNWNAESTEQEVFNLRTAVSIGRDDGGTQYRVRILTNLANALDRVGRSVEAVAQCDRARAQAPEYGMPVASRGIALVNYARSLPDHGHQRFILHHASLALEQALRMPLDSDVIRQRVADVRNFARKSLGTYEPPDQPSSIGDDGAERQYRSWALRHRLFLNPLNDLCELPLAAYDPLSFLSISTKVDEGPHFFGFFNGLKQEYAAARFLLFQGLHREGVHFSDRGVKLVNTLDYPALRLAIEEVKIAFRMAFSLFDKIAFFLNDYFAVGIAEKNVTFKKLWYNESKQGELREIFRERPNLPLRGLYWIAKDLFEKRSEYLSVTEPEARELENIRHHLEHKHLRVVDSIGLAQGTPGILSDPLAHLVGRADFEARALRVLQLARASLIHVACAVASEERSRTSHGSTIALPMILEDLDDNWKQ